MDIYIAKVERSGRKWRVTVPMSLIREKGWENVTHVSVKGNWGDRIVLTKVAVNEESKKKDT